MVEPGRERLYLSAPASPTSARSTLWAVDVAFADGSLERQGGDVGRIDALRQIPKSMPAEGRWQR